MKIISISDTHTLHDKITDKLLKIEADMIIHAGDIMNSGYKEGDITSFLVWFDSLPFKYKIFIAGNHDRYFESYPEKVQDILKHYPNIIYLENSSVEIEGIKIYGSPDTPYFFNWAFNRQPTELEAIWKKIPEDTNILVTHGPPEFILDEVESRRYFGQYDNVGDPALARRTALLLHLKYHMFGHLHLMGGKQKQIGNTLYINAAVCNEDYRPINDIFVFEYGK